MDYKEFCDYFYKTYFETPLSAQVSKQDKSIFHLKMELAKLKKQLSELQKNKED